MKKIIFRSIFAQFALTFIVSIAFFNSVLMMEKLLRMSRILSDVGATFFDMISIIVSIQPQLLVLTIPISLLLSTLIVYGRMNVDSEIIVLRSCGLNFLQIASPVIAAGLCSFVLSIIVNFFVAPASSARLRDKLTEIITLRSSSAIEEGTFHSAFKDVVIMIKGKRPPDTLESIFIYDSRNKNEPMVLMAKDGRLSVRNDFTIALTLNKGYMNIVRGENITEVFFDTYRIILQLQNEFPQKKNIELTPLELLRKARERKTEGFQKAASWYLEFHRRLSLPALCIILAFLGPPLALMAGKSGRLGGLALGLLVVASYYMILVYGENLVRTGKLPHYAGGWFPFAVILAFTVFMFRRENSK